MLIERACESDVPAILALQKLAFLAEAELYGDYSIPPLTQTEASLRAELGQAVVLKATETGRIVGTVRGRCAGDTCHVGRLAVHPDLRCRGIGTALMRMIEAACGDVRRFELYTGGRSEGNLRLYRGLGYSEFKRERLSAAVSLVFMEKTGDTVVGAAGVWPPGAPEGPQ
jgi:ribosomal protein S18 acetylase RimI-like enzyme